MKFVAYLLISGAAYSIIWYSNSFFAGWLAANLSVGAMWLVDNATIKWRRN